MVQKKLSTKISVMIPFLLILVLALIYFFPILLMITSSLKSNDQIFDMTIGIFPRRITFENYGKVFEKIPFAQYAWNSVWVAGVNVVGTCLCTPLIAYSLAKIQWKGRNIVFAIITMCMMIPYTVTMIPLYKIWVKLKMVGTFWPLIIPTYLGQPFYIILLRQFMLTIPDELMDAAEIDGCGKFKTLVRIIIPLSKPGIATIAIFTFMTSFSDFLGPLLYANDESHYTISIGLYDFIGAHSVDWGGLAAAAAMFMIPIMIVFLFCQRYLIDGISTSGLKG